MEHGSEFPRFGRSCMLPRWNRNAFPGFPGAHPVLLLVLASIHSSLHCMALRFSSWTVPFCSFFYSMALRVCEWNCILYFFFCNCPRGIPILSPFARSTPVHVDVQESFGVPFHPSLTRRRHGSGGGGRRCGWFGHDTCVASGRTQSDAVGAKPQGRWDVGIRHRTKRHVPILADQLAT